MKDTFIIIANGKAARKYTHKLSTSFGRLQRANIPFKVVETEQPKEATKIAKEMFHQGHTKFISAGGDGTTFEILNGLFPHALNQPLSLGFLPLGTGNSFVRDFSDQAERYTIEAIIRGRKAKVDVALLENEESSAYFLNILSVGFVARVAKLRNSLFSGLGSLGYKLSVLLKAIGEKTYPLEFAMDGGNLAFDKDMMFASFSNSKYTGGSMLMAPNANISDGKIDVVAAYPMLTEEIIATFPEIYKGSHLSHPKIKSAQAREITFSHTQKQPMMIDGEILEACPKSIKVIPQALEVLL